MGNHLSEAANSDYASLYTSAIKPFFFIGTQKSYLPFVEENLTYERARDIDPLNYATGHYQSDGEVFNWYYSLYNDERNKKNILALYHQLIKTIEEIKIIRKTLNF